MKARPFYIVRCEGGELGAEDVLLGSLTEVRGFLRHLVDDGETVRVFRVTESEEITDKVRPA